MRIPATLAVLALAALPAAISRADPAPVDTDTERYFLVFLRPDPERKPIEQPERERIMNAHMANIHKMAEDGILVAAGPMEDKATTISGVFIFKADSLAEAGRIASLDPTVTGKRNKVDVHPWLAPKGIGAAYSQWKKENPNAEDAMAVHPFCILRRGPAWKDDAQSDDAHARFVDSLRRAGALAAAGGVEGDPDMLEICVFKAPSVDEAQQAIARDPAVQSGRIAAEFHRWWTADRVLPW